MYSFAGHNLFPYRAGILRIDVDIALDEGVPDQTRAAEGLPVNGADAGGPTRPTTTSPRITDSVNAFDPIITSEEAHRTGRG